MSQCLGGKLPATRRTSRVEQHGTCLDTVRLIECALQVCNSRLCSRNFFAPTTGDRELIAEELHVCRIPAENKIHAGPAARPGQTGLNGQNKAISGTPATTTIIESGNPSLQ
jgi:hypothetical protein